MDLNLPADYEYFLIDSECGSKTKPGHLILITSPTEKSGSSDLLPVYSNFNDTLVECGVFFPPIATWVFLIGIKSCVSDGRAEELSIEFFKKDIESFPVSL